MIGKKRGGGKLGIRLGAGRTASKGTGSPARTGSSPRTTGAATPSSAPVAIRLSRSASDGTVERAGSRPEDAWERLGAAVEAVHHATRLTGPGLSREELYAAVENVVRAGPESARWLYDRVLAAVGDQATTLLRRLAAESEARGGDGAEASSQMLQRLVAMAERRAQEVVTIRNIFLYLDRAFAVPTPGVDAIQVAARGQMRAWLLSSHGASVRDRVIQAMLDLVERDRKGEAVDRAVIGATSRLLVSLDLFSLLARDPLLADTRAFYSTEGNALREAATSADGAAAFFAQAESRFRQEAQRAEQLLDPISLGRPLQAIVEEELLVRHGAAVLQQGVSLLVEAKRDDDVARVYALCSRPALALHVSDSRGDTSGTTTAGAMDVSSSSSSSLSPSPALGPADTKPAPEVLATVLGAWTEAQARAIIGERGTPDADRKLIPRMLALRDRVQALWEGPLGSNYGISRAFRAALTRAVNGGGDRVSQLLAKFIDAHLKAGARSVLRSRGGAGGAASAASAGSAASAEQEAEEILDKALEMFRMLRGKDVFEAFYKNDLAKRLLLGRSASDDLERAVLSKLKAECGAAFTSKLEGMFRDVAVSKDLMAEFRKAERDASAKEDAPAAAAPGGGSLDMEVHMLTTTYWPTYPKMSLLLPPTMKDRRGAFESFYTSKFSSSRTLTWQPALGHCTVRARFPRGMRELLVSEVQAVLLLAFNPRDGDDRAQVSYETLEADLGVSDAEDLNRALASFCRDKVRILQPRRPGPKLGKGSAFSVNLDFTSSQVRLRINQAQARETDRETKATQERVEQDRTYQIEAAIVRILKSRKSLAHSALMSDVLGQLRFPAAPAHIKKRIESLIDRDFLERDDDDHNLYHYVA